MRRDRRRGASSDRVRVLSSVVASQIDVHRDYGGVVPELAARHHVEAIGVVIAQALERGGRRRWTRSTPSP